MSYGLMRTRVMESRAYDSHYDPVFTYSGDRPRMGGIPAWSNSTTVVNQAARTGGNYRVASRPSGATFRQTQQATVPAIMPDGTIGRVAAPKTESSVPRVVGLNGPMSEQQVALQLNSEVLGRSRVKFFKRPVVPFLAAQTDGLHPDEAAALQAQANMEAAAALQAQQMQAQTVELHRTYGTQTDYRESETQTDPYTPDYITSPDEPEPEILGLAHLTYGQGLPASMDELKLIQRMREKKAFEASLPPITDASSFELRKQMLEQRELAEWALREEEMKQEQEDRLQILMDTLKLRESKIEELNEIRVDAIRQKKIRERDQIFEAVHKERIKVHRALGKTRVELDDSTAHMSGGYKELTSSHHASSRRHGLRDIVGDYADHGSQVYAPIQRQGKLPVKNQVVDYGIPLLSNFQGLSDLEKHLPSSATSLSVAPPTIHVKSLATRKGQAIRRDLDYVDSLLEAQRAAGGPVGIAGEAKANYGKTGKGLVENKYKKFEPVQRAPTPTVTVPDEEESARAILLLQRLLRGRVVQNAMFEGKQHHRALIRELRVVEDLPEELPLDANEALHHALDTLQGELASGALDFVSKEVVRMEEENRILALVKSAELTRRHREAEESGRRQAESVLRQKKEAQLAEMLHENALAAERYLDEMVSLSLHQHANNQANKQSSIHSEHIDPSITSVEAQAAQEAKEGEEKDGCTATEVIVGDLVQNFLFAEVERRKERRTHELADRRFIKEAHEAVFQALDGLQPPPAEQQEEEQ